MAPWPPLRDEKAINKAHKLLLEGTKIIDYCLLLLAAKLEAFFHFDAILRVSTFY